MRGQRQKRHMGSNTDLFRNMIQESINEVSITPVKPTGITGKTKYDCKFYDMLPCSFEISDRFGNGVLPLSLPDEVHITVDVGGIYGKGRLHPKMPPPTTQTEICKSPTLSDIEKAINQLVLNAVAPAVLAMKKYEISPTATDDVLIDISSIVRDMETLVGSIKWEIKKNGEDIREELRLISEDFETLLEKFQNTIKSLPK